jgi:trehalose/maltose transport system substrate-binding protein
VWQGRAYEGLTCNALEWLASSGGGTVIDSGGVVTVNNPSAVSALERAADWVGTISPPGVTTYAEEDARAIWQSGNAAFMRNWPYAYALGREPDPETGERPEIAEAFEVCPLPSGGEGPAAALGGWQLMVSRHSRRPELAVELVRFLASPEEQKIRAIRGSLTPTVRLLYRDPEVLEAVPVFGELEAVLTGAVPRPSAVAGERYNRVSEAFFTAVHDVLGGAPAASRLEELERELRRILR